MEYGLIGARLGHSFSKEIHEAIAGYNYELKEVSGEQLDSFMREKAFKAINVTIPYKEAVLPYLDEVSNEAQAIGAVNVILNQNRKLIGYNTDVTGFLLQLRHMGLDASGKVVAVLGDGGASKAIRTAFEMQGASRIYIVSRKNKAGTISYEQLKALKDIQIIANATPVGMYPHNLDTLIEFDDFPALEGFVDAIYNPLRTMMVLKAQEKGIKAEGGLYMLVAQAVKASEIFLGTSYSSQTIDNEYHRLRLSRHNIVLIGMPSSGKSTIGKRLSETLRLPLIDLDEEIIKATEMPIPDFFQKYGEPAFRNEESQAIDRIYQHSPAIISTGGGAILSHDNVLKLRQNGTLYFLNRRIDLLSCTDDRPLSKTQDSLQKLYQFRLPLYQKAADFIVDNNEDIEHALKQILEEERR